LQPFSFFEVRVKNIKGLLLIFFSVIITLFVWVAAVSGLQIAQLDKARHVVAGLALCGFFLQFLLAARFSFIERWFNGLDKLYVVHKWVAISSLALVEVHAILSGILETVESFRLTKVLGWVALVLFIMVVVLSLFGQYVKLLKLPWLEKFITYENWRFLHRFALLAYTVGLGVVSTNPKAVGFYEHCGMERTREFVQYEYYQ
jgi:predicted ferric reductase